MPTICLCMIVRDEAHVIERCLASVRELISYWVICDTGSGDGTPDLIRRALDGVPGELHERPWVDFGHNRTEALELARGRADYLLLLDADWTLSVQADALSALTADVYLVRKRGAQGAGAELYVRQLVRGDRRWWYQGATHEFIATGERCAEERLDGVLITDWADGSVGRERRWRQDAELLERTVSEKPDDARSVFYLAQTYRDLGETDRAIELYRRRAGLGGWSEEVYSSLYQVGLLHTRRNAWAEAVNAFLEAWSVRPVRIEPLYRLAAGYRRRGLHPAAHVFAERAVGRPVPDDLLHLEPWIYRWGALFEYSITAYYAGDPRSALDACDRLLAIGDLPDEYRAHTVRNRGFCRQALGEAAGSFALGSRRVVVTNPGPSGRPPR